MEERTAQESGTTVGTCQGSCKMGRKGPAAEGGEVQENQPAPCSDLY